MRKSLFLLSAMLTVLLVFHACKKENVQDPRGPEPPVDYPLTDVQVVLPQGAAADLSKTQIVAMSVRSGVSADGKAKVAFNKGSTELAYLFNASDKLMMMGFISDHNKEISAKTTAQALLYLALDITYQPDTCKQVFLKNTPTLPGLQDYYKEIEQVLKADLLMLEKRTFQTALQKIVTELKRHNELDIHGKPQVYVVTDETKSQLNVQSIDEKSVKVNNLGVRRGHAFVYKTTYRTRQSRVNLLDEISGSVEAKQNLRVLPASYVTKVIDQVGSVTSYQPAVNGPINLPLESGETEATYKVRVVGVGQKPSLSLTTAEAKKIEELYYDMFALELLMPLMLDAEAQKGFYHSFSDEDVRPFVEKTKAMLASIPQVMVNMKEGEFALAISGFLASIDEKPSHIWEELAATLVHCLQTARNRLPGQGRTVQGQDAARGTVANMGSALRLTKFIIDHIEDHQELKEAIAKCNQLEEWEVISKDNDVKVSPRSSSVTTLTNHPLTVSTSAQVNANQVLWYEWKTAGRFGELRDGSTKGLTLATDKATVNYYGTLSSANLTEENNIEQVIVKVYVKEGASLVEVGADTATINVKKNKLQMEPDGITLSLTKGGTSSVRLYLQKPDGTNDIVSNSALDYKVVWSTAGNYGKFYGTETTAETAGNAVNYTALDDKVKNGVENIVAKVYFKAKKDTRWVLREEVKGTVKIDNDEKKKILHLPLSVIHGDNQNSDVSRTCYWSTIVTIPEEKDAKSYTVRIYNVRWPETHSWQAGQSVPDAPPAWLQPGYANGVYTLEYSASWQVGASSLPHMSHSGRSDGRAEVIIYLK